MSIELALVLIGTITGVTGSSIMIWVKMNEKAVIGISDVLLPSKTQYKFHAVAELSFKVDNVGDRSKEWKG